MAPENAFQINGAGRAESANLGNSWSGNVGLKTLPNQGFGDLGSACARRATSIGNVDMSCMVLKNAFQINGTGRAEKRLVWRIP
jgi:hypothetical protein